MRRFAVGAGLLCVVASIAVAGSALAHGGGPAGSRAAGTAGGITPRALLKGKPFTTKIEVVHAKSETLALVAVELHGEKLAFIVDTGASQSQVSDEVAKQLKLDKVGKPVKVAGVGCTTKAQQFRADNWSIAGHALPALTIGSSSLPGGDGKLAGLLGSDVLSKFGAARIDYANETLTLG